jgi:hypothetical protein
MCRNESISSKEVSAANLLLISAANSGHVKDVVLILVLLSQWSALPTKKTSRNLTLLCHGVLAKEKHFLACLSQPAGLSPSNLGKSNLIPLLND